MHKPMSTFFTFVVITVASMRAHVCAREQVCVQMTNRITNKCVVPLALTHCLFLSINRFPSGFKWLSAQLRSRGLKLGLWTIRGVKIDAVKAKSKVYGTPYTVDELVDIEPVGGGPNGSCLWEKATLGINASHPGTSVCLSVACCSCCFDEGFPWYWQTKALAHTCWCRLDSQC